MNEKDFLEEFPEETELLDELPDEELFAEESAQLPSGLFFHAAPEEEGLLDEDLLDEELDLNQPLGTSYFEDVPAEEVSTNEPYSDEVPPEEVCNEEYIPEDDLHHESLAHPEIGEELTPDDQAMYSAGLLHPEDTQEMEEAPAEELTEASAESKRRERPAHKGRPRRRKGYGLLGIPNMLATVIWLLIIVAIGVTMGRMIWVCAADVLAFGRESKEVSISITTDDTMETITEKLYDAGLINIPELFLLYADLTDAQEDITTGTFTLNTIYDYHALVNMMSPRSISRVIVEDVLIPEGYNCRQIFERLEEKGICKVADLEEWAANGELDDYWFLEGVERGDKYCLEGYLFPATYDFYENSTPKQVLEKMLDAFEYNFSEELRSQLPILNERISKMMRDDGRSEEYIAENQIGLHELITVASLIEEETSSNEESPMIASVIYNRLFSWGSTPRYLNIDASIIYALGGKTNLTSEDMTVESPYNTYTNTGLTPGPISNPGLASIKAAVDPADTSYYYYVLDPEAGEHIFARTLAEHEKNAKEVSGE